MTGSITRGKAFRADLANWDGKTSTATRLDATGGPVTGLAIGNEVDVLQIYGAGTARTRLTIADAVQQIGSASATLVFAPGIWTIDDNLTIPSNFTCHVPAGCVFNVSSGKTLTFSGPVYKEAATWTSGSGTVLVNADMPIIPWGRTSGEIAASVSPINYKYPAVDARRYCVCDGTTDDSTALQGAVDSNKGSLVIIPAGVTVLAAGILLSGSSYNNTVIRIEGIFKLKASAGANNFQSAAWVGIILKDCDNCTVDIFDSDGNRSNQAANEHHYILGIAGATNINIPRFHCREIRGDGIYISQSTWTSTSANPSNIRLGRITGANSADDGRNLVSVISCTKLSVASFDSYQIGGTINGTLMPGGFDIEPDQTYHSCVDITLGSGNIVTAGTSGFQISGKAITNDATRDWNCQYISTGPIRIKRTGTSGSGLAASPIIRCRDVHLDIATHYSTTRGKGLQIDWADRMYGRLEARSVTQGITLGTSNELTDFEFECHVSDYDTAAIRPNKVTNGKVRGRVYGAVAASTAFAIQCHNEARGSQPQTNVVYSVDAPYDGVNSRAFRNEPANPCSFSNTLARDCDWSGYASYTVCFDAEIPKVAIRGVNFAAAMPGNGDWIVGDKVANSVPAAGTVEGWARVTTGTANVLGTDWVAYGCFQAANAYTVTNPTTDRALNVTADTLPQVAEVLGTLIADLQSSGVLK